MASEQREFWSAVAVGVETMRHGSRSSNVPVEYVRAVKIQGP